MTSPDRKPVPRFASEDEEREFWATHDSVDYIDWSKARRVAFPNLNPSPRKTISIQLPEWLINDLKLIADSQDVPYQSLVEIFLADRVGLELSTTERTKANDHQPH